MKTLRSTRFLLLLGLVALSGCATVKLQHPRIDNVKSVALIGYTGAVDMRTDDEKNGKGGGGIMGTINAVKNVSEMASGELQKSRGAQAEKAYEMLSKKLGEATGWKVLDKASLASNADYQKHLKENPNEGVRVIGLQTMPTVLREDVARAMNAAQRAALAKSLGVDAVALVHVDYVVGDTSGFAIGGMGKITKYPKAVVKFSVFDTEGEDEVWREYRAEGKPTKDGFAQTMGVNSDEGETPILVAAADSAYDVLIEHYKGAK